MDRDVILKYVYYGITIVSVVVVGLSIKYLLGGYEEINIVEGGSVEHTIAGKFLRGKDLEEDREAIRQTSREELAKGRLKGQLASIYYYPDTLQAGEEIQFVGIAFEGSIVTLPAGFEVLELEANSSLSTLLTMNSIFRPRSIDVWGNMVDYANTNQFFIENWLLELEVGQDSLRYVTFGG